MSEGTADLLQRMRKIEGQARGIQRMLEEERPCQEIAHQLGAMRSALGRVAAALIATHLEECLERAPDEERRAAALARVAEMLARV